MLGRRGPNRRRRNANVTVPLRAGAKRSGNKDLLFIALGYISEP
jgi:hypothetical protein